MSKRLVLPADFDPKTATASQLLAFGLPSRPRDSILAEHWDVMLRAGTTVLEPRLRPAGRRHVRADVREETNWSGAWCTTAERVTRVAGRFSIPQPRAIPSYDDASCAIWVGLGDGDSNLVQAGVNCEVLSAGGPNIHIVPWFEWLPDDQQTIDDFPIHIGDSIRIMITVTSDSLVNVLLHNENTGMTARPRDCAAPAGSSAIASCVEWIVERPRINDRLVPLLDYQAVRFDGCAGETQAGTRTPGADDAVQMVDGDLELSRAEVEQGSVICTYVGPRLA